MDPQGHDPLTDAALDGEIRRALAVDPSPEFLARVRTRIAEEPAPRGRGLSWVVVAPAVFALALLTIVALWQRPPAQSPLTAPALLTARPLGSTAPVSPPAVASSSAVAQAFRPAIAGLKPRATGVKDEPEVLIAADEVRALQQLIFNVQEGRIALPPALATSPVDEIVIDPIAVAPIPPMTGEQGVRQ